MGIETPRAWLPETPESITSLGAEPQGESIQGIGPFQNHESADKALTAEPTDDTPVIPDNIELGRN